MAISRRRFLAGLAAAPAAAMLAQAASAAQGAGRKPNFIVVFADDLGYGDLGCFGHPTIHTPHLDQMARDGVRMTSFYAAAAVCSPSRAALMTGRYPVRCGMPGNTGPGSSAYLPESEITLANVLGNAGYRTMAVGKWHLGHQRPELLPTGRGFDTWFGLPYSNDMIPPWVQTDEPLYLYRDATPLTDEQPVDQNTLTERYTEEAVQFIRKSGDKPFFLYLAHSMPHLPVRTSDQFRGKSAAELYGDVISTIDWSAGRIREVLREQGIEDDTLLIFTSDNGPWLNLPDRMLQDGNERWHAGSPGPLRGAKATSYEGGFRVPMIACWPGRLPAGVRSEEIATTMDFFPTFAGLAGTSLPSDRTYDGHDLIPVLEGGASAYERFHYYINTAQQAVREGDWKLRRENAEAPIELYHLGRDPSERYNVADEHPDIVARLLGAMEAFGAEVGHPYPVRPVEEPPEPRREPTRRRRILWPGRPAPK